MDALRCRIPHGHSVAANTNGKVYGRAPGAGKWRLKAAGVLPNATSAPDGTNYVTYTLKNAAGTTIGSFTTASTGLTAGTYRGFTFTASVNPEFDGDGTDVVEVSIDKSGTGVAVAGYVELDWESVQAT